MRHSAYRDDTKLAVRHRLHSYVVGQLPSPRGRIFAAIEPAGDETVVDVGCGFGSDLRALTKAGHRGLLIGVDISTGMLRRVGVAPAKLICADACSLPLPAALGDIVMAMSMLYHVADIDEALHELRRILKPGGTFVASTSSSSDMRELVDVWEQATREVVGRELGLRERWARSFNVENGEPILRRVFDSVEVRSFDWAIAPPDARSVREYAESRRDFDADVFPDDTWTAVVNRLEELVSEQIARDGGFRIGVKKGIFVAR
jgi:SAM-dependent methyltransferase